MINCYFTWLHNNPRFSNLVKAEDVKTSEIVGYYDFNKICNSMPSSVIKVFFKNYYADLSCYNTICTLSDILEKLADQIDDDITDLEDYNYVYDDMTDGKFKKCFEEALEPYFDWALKQKVKVSYKPD